MKMNRSRATATSNYGWDSLVPHPAHQVFFPFHVFPTLAARETTSDTFLQTWPSMTSGQVSHSMRERAKKMRNILSSLTLVATIGCGGMDPPVATTLTVNPEEALLVSVGETVLLTAEIEDQYGDPMEGEEVTWASNNEQFATVSDGTVTAVADGTASITATLGTLAGTATVTIDQRAHTLSVIPDSVLLGAAGDDAQMSIEALDARGNVIERPAATWTIADPAVATVSDDGLVTSVADGETTLEAKVDEAAGTATITVDKQRAGLMTLYDSTAGEDWSNNENWGTAADLGEWYGVETDADGNVHSLELGGNNLAGTIPAAIGLLDEIRTLDLSGNKLAGTIPAAIGSLDEISILDLSDNSIGGRIPPGTFDSTLDLTALYIHSNQLSGEVPPGIPLSTPGILEMHGNGFSGDLPREFIGNVMTRFSWNAQDGLCAPGDDEFQDWLATIPSHAPGPVSVSREFREDFDTAGSLKGWEVQYARMALQDSMLVVDSADDGGWPDPDESPRAYRKLGEIKSNWVLKTSTTVEGDIGVSTVMVYTGDSRRPVLSVDLDFDFGEWYIEVYDADEDRWFPVDEGEWDFEFGELMEVEWEFADGFMILALDGEEVSNSSQDLPSGITGVGLGIYDVSGDEDKALFDYIDIRPKG